MSALRPAAAGPVLELAGITKTYNPGTPVATATAAELNQAITMSQSKSEAHNAGAARRTTPSGIEIPAVATATIRTLERIRKSPLVTAPVLSGRRPPGSGPQRRHRRNRVGTLES